MNRQDTAFTLTLALPLTALAVTVALAQTPAPAAVRPLALTAVSANVNGAGEKVELFINKWSSDAERDKLVAAWKVTPAGRGAAPADGAAPPAARAGGGGRGGRGAGANATAATPRTPEGALLAALKELPAAGYFWTSEVGGYVIHYAYQLPQPNGGSRIILLTDKRLGAAKNNWKVGAPATPNSYEFTLIELRLPAKGTGEGKASLTGTVTIDPGTNGVTLDGYETLPVMLQDVKAKPNS